MIHLFTFWKKKEVRKKDLLKLPNVMGYGNGKKITKGKETNKECLQVFVKKKVSTRRLKPEEKVPKQVEDQITDVIEIGGECVAYSVDHKKRFRPIKPGISGAHGQTTAGTIGLVVYREGIYIGDVQVGFLGRSIEWLKQHFPQIISKKSFWLTNNHVGALENDGELGDAFIQPGPLDRGYEKVGYLYDYVMLKNMATVDACLIRPLVESLVDETILDKGKPKGVATPVIGMKVKKSGRTTGLTTGIVKATGVTIQIQYSRLGSVYLKDCMLLSNMSAGGDSGSAVLDENDNVIGLIFAGNSTISIACDINNVFDALKIQL